MLLNYLAHLFLAELTNTSRLGSILGDFVKGRDFEAFSPPITTGIMLHRHVDGFTDRHPVNHKLRQLFPASLQRYRGICLDLFWDYCLSQSWDNFYPQSKNQFVGEHYATLSDELHLLKMTFPAEKTNRVDRMISRMISYDWLSSYQEMSNIHLALQRIGQRLRQPVALEEATEVLANNEASIQRHFDEFFPEVISFSTTTAKQLTLLSKQ